MKTVPAEKTFPLKRMLAKHLNPKEAHAESESEQTQVELMRQTIAQKRIMQEKKMKVNQSSNPVNEPKRLIVQRALGLKGLVQDGARW